MPDFQTMTIDETRTHRDTVLLRLLMRVAQIETKELLRRLRARGHSLQPGHITLLGNVDTQGIRLVDLAERMGVTRQAISQQVKEVERHGVLERLSDPGDGRAVLVRHTAEGRRVLVDALEVMDDIESEYVDVIGRSQMDDLKAALTAIADHVDPAWRFGRPPTRRRRAGGAGRATSASGRP